MKNLLIIIFMLLTPPFYGQWVAQNPNTGGLRDIYCITENFVVAVGNSGIITKTTDGGTTWVQKNIDATYNLTKVQFANTTTGYTIGTYQINNLGVLLKTSNGGENWSILDIPNITNINSISVVNENVFYLIGSDSLSSKLLKTINGGITYETVYLNSVYENFQFVNEQVGYFGESGGLYKTTDCGVTLLQVNNLGIIDFQFIDENVGFFRSYNGDLYKSIDSGVSYDYLSSTNINMGKIYASSQNVVWGIRVNLLLNGQPNYTMRGETLQNGLFERMDINSPLLFAVHFATHTKGYAIEVGNNIIYKNSTGLMLGKNNIEEKQKLKIYPNPASEQINISLNEKLKVPFSIEITDFLGKKIYSQSYFIGNDVIVDSKTFSKGIYLVSIRNQDFNETQKIVIK